jgi:hypothetical protein
LEISFGRTPPKTTVGKVIDLRPQIERAKWAAANVWDLGTEHFDAIAATPRSGRLRGPGVPTRCL